MAISRVSLSLVSLAALVSVVLAEGSAAACGGCFPAPPPPGERASVVTDHRMVLAIGRGRSTLYDQIRYSGSPSEFAWVLPIAGEVEVGLGSDTLFAGLDAITETRVEAPPTGCPAPSCGGGGGFGCGSVTTVTSGGSFEEQAPTSPVTVTKQQVVGPYATVELQSRTPGALVDWLAANGFALSDDVRGIVERYVAEHFDFLAVKLRPGASVRAMRPIRVTSVGPTVVLPLRMVAAGAGANVGITLWTVAEGRYEPQNFPWFRVEDMELAWNWADSVSNYREIRSAKAALHGGRGWELESVKDIQTGSFPGANLPLAAGQFPDPLDGYVASEEGSASEAKRADLERLYDGRTEGVTRVTRLRADLVRAALSEDLVLAAAVDSFPLSNVRFPMREIGEPICPVIEDCRVVGTAPRSEAIARSDGDCSTAGTASHEASGFAATFGVLAFVMVRRRRDLRGHPI